MLTKDGAVDERRIIEKLREDLRARQRGEPLPCAPGAPANRGGIREDLEIDLAVMDAGHDIYDVSLRSHRPMVGVAVVAAKKLVRQLLAPVLERQVTYNAAALRVLRAVAAEVLALTREHRDEVDELRRVQAAQRVELDALRKELEGRGSPRAKKRDR